MSNPSDVPGAPLFRRVSRRRLLKLLVAMGGLASLAMVEGPRSSGTPPAATVLPEDTPVRNPAFRLAPSTAGERRVLFCSVPGQPPVAYELNEAALWIWQACPDHAAFGRGERRSVIEISDRFGGGHGIENVLPFIAALYRAGLAYPGHARNTAYYLWEGPH